MSSLWRELPTEFRSMADEMGERIRTYRRLQLCEVMDNLTGTMARDFWIVALENSGETLLVLLCDEARAVEIATEFAHMTDWTRVADWDGIALLPAQHDILDRYPTEASQPMLREPPQHNWDDVIPYGPN